MVSNILCFCFVSSKTMDETDERIDFFVVNINAACSGNDSRRNVPPITSIREAVKSSTELKNFLQNPR